MTNTPEAARINLRKVALAIDEALKGAEFAGTEKDKLAVACLDTALEHQAGILLLGTEGVYGSMLALLRPMAESYVRGTWLYRCADAKGLSDFKKAKLKPFAQLANEIDAARGIQAKPPIKKFVDGFHDFTHTGIDQVRRRNIAGGSYSDEDLAKAYNLASTFGLFTALELASLAKDHVQRVPKVAQCVDAFLAIEAQR